MLPREVIDEMFQEYDFLPGGPIEIKNPPFIEFSPTRIQEPIDFVYTDALDLHLDFHRPKGRFVIARGIGELNESYCLPSRSLAFLRIPKSTWKWNEININKDFETELKTPWAGVFLTTISGDEIKPNTRNPVGNILEEIISTKLNGVIKKGVTYNPGLSHFQTDLRGKTIGEYRNTIGLDVKKPADYGHATPAVLGRAIMQALEAYENLQF